MKTPTFLIATIMMWIASCGIGLAQDQSKNIPTDNTEQGDDCDRNYINTHEYIYCKLNSQFKVKGEANILSFVKALPLFDNDFWKHEKPTVDIPNGYFSFQEEGDGSINYKAAYWNCKDGTKLFIISWFSGENIYYHKDDTRPFGATKSENQWYRYIVLDHSISEDGTVFRIGLDSGCMAYVFDAKTSTLKPLVQPPFNHMPATEDLRHIVPPQKGKNIEVLEYRYDQDLSTDVKTHTLKWNGHSFDYIK